jgi:hypothetical protein
VEDIKDPLYVIAVISNPRRFNSRYDLYENFAKYIADSGAILVTVEVAFGDRPFEVTSEDNPFHVQLRTETELWHKENMINIGISRLPQDWKYVAWVDADITFARHDWVAETIHMLQHHHVVQMFSVAQDLSPDFEPFNKRTGFIAAWVETGRCMDTSGRPNYFGFLNSHPGYAWAATRYAIDTVGGLYEEAILGAGDHHMACCLVGEPDASLPLDLHPEYHASVHRWAERAAVLDRNVGFVAGLVNHHWHGKKKDRRYNDRWKILVDNLFDPVKHIYKDAQGLMRFAHNVSHKLRDGVRNYFRARNEDSIDME